METKDACEPPPLPLKALEGDPVFENDAYLVLMTF